MASLNSSMVTKSEKKGKMSSILSISDFLKNSIANLISSLSFITHSATKKRKFKQNNFESEFLKQKLQNYYFYYVPIFNQSRFNNSGSLSCKFAVFMARSTLTVRAKSTADSQRPRRAES